MNYRYSKFQLVEVIGIAVLSLRVARQIQTCPTASEMLEDINLMITPQARPEFL
ncbi:MAG TPA: hypothetical protein VFG46_10370 [Chryseolinea sp.]|nr:hypothetical protein [Chryseolinea sp.]